MITITKNPKKKTYKDLMELAFKICDSFHLVIRKDMGTIEDYNQILQRLESSLIEMKEESEWASTILGDGQTAYVYYYNTDNNAKKVVLESSNNLFGWEHPDLPEDLSFFKNNKEWLVTISHEKEAFIYNSDKSELDQINAIKGLKILHEND